MFCRRGISPTLYGWEAQRVATPSLPIPQKGRKSYFSESHRSGPDKGSCAPRGRRGRRRLHPGTPGAELQPRSRSRRQELISHLRRTRGSGCRQRGRHGRAGRAPQGGTERGPHSPHEPVHGWVPPRREAPAAADSPLTARSWGPGPLRARGSSLGRCVRRSLLRSLRRSVGRSLPGRGRGGRRVPPPG